MSQLAVGLLHLAGALGLFLYAISRFGDAVQKMAGERIRGVLESQSRQPFSSLFTGMGMAAALQNNFLTFGMITSLVNAGLLGLLPALWIMLGVNMGMTVTTQLIAMNLGVVALSFLFLGYILYFYSSNKNWHYIGQVIFNLGLMFLGFSIFQTAFHFLAAVPGCLKTMRTLVLNPWLGFLLGLCLAALFRSSNTVVVMVQALIGTELALTTPEFLSGAFTMVIGANVGTTFIHLLLGFNRIPTARRANWLHFGFNLSVALLWLLFLPAGYHLVHGVCLKLTELYLALVVHVFKWSSAWGTHSIVWFKIWQLAMAHTVFNLTVILIWFPVTLFAAKTKLALFQDNGRIGANENSYLDRRALHSPALALILAAHEINQMASLVQEMLKSARLAFLKGQSHLTDSVNRDEEVIDDLQEQITFYLSALLSQNTLTESQSRRLAGLLHVVTDIERVGDHANSIAHLAAKRYQEQLPFSELALNELELFIGKSMDVFNKACQALRDDNVELAKQIQNREGNIDKLEEELRHNHIYRLNQGKCWPGSGVIYVEMLSNLQRIAAHSSNIAAVVLGEGD